MKRLPGVCTDHGLPGPGEEPGKYHHRCMHCETLFVPVCTTGDEQVGLRRVLYEPDICIACRSAACSPALTKYPSTMKKQSGIVKCSMCAHRVVQGNIPACVEACPTSALEFGEAKPSGPGGKIAAKKASCSTALGPT